MADRKIVQDSDDESNWGNSPSPTDHESHDPSLNTIDLPSSSPRKIIEQSEQPSTSSTERLNRDLRDAHNNLLEPTPNSIPSAKRSRHSSEQPSPSSSSQITKGQKRRATLGIREKKIKKYGRTSREGGDFYEHSEDELGGRSLSQKSNKHRILYEEAQDNHTTLEDSAAASRVNSMLNDYRGPEISILSSGGIGKHFSLETSVQQIALPSIPSTNRNIPTQQSESSTWPTIPHVTPAQSSSNGRAATHGSNADITNTAEQEEATFNGQTTSEANSSSGPNKTTYSSRDNTDSANIRDQAALLSINSSKQSTSQTFKEQETSNSAAADDLGSDDPAIGLPKDQYQPRPSRSRGNHKESDLFIPESFSKRPEALVKEKRKAKNRRKTTALERPTPKIEIEDEDEEEVKVPLVAIPKLPPRPRDQYPYNDDDGCEKSPRNGPKEAIAVEKCLENNNDGNRAEQEAKERKEASPSPKKRGRGRPKKQAIYPADDPQDLESGDEAGDGPTAQRKSRTDHEDEASADDQAALSDTDHPDPPIPAQPKRKLDHASDHDKAPPPPKKRGRKKKSDQPAPTVTPLNQEEVITNEHLNKTLSPTAISPTKIATPPTTPPKPVHSPITCSTVKFRVGLSKKARIAPLLKIVRK
ncbi:MAG: hypothetical protein Q9195_005297 [Heterodermia aff. obscurata]